MKNRININERELKTSIRKVLNEQLLNKSVESKLFPNVIDKMKRMNDGVYKDFDKSYDYKLENMKWFFKRKTDKSNNWVSLEKYPAALKKLYGQLSSTLNKKYQKANNQKFIMGFQLWMNKNKPNWFKGGKLPNNYLGTYGPETKNAMKTYKQSYVSALKQETKKSGTLWDDVKNLASVAGVALDAFLTFTSPAYSGVKTAGNAAVRGVKKFLRKQFPNVIQLFYSRDLDESDFKPDQLAVIKTAVNNAVKRTGKTKLGATEYVDYGKENADKWFGPGGVKSVDMVLNTLNSNPIFMIATTLGRFTYRIENGKLKVTDIYDFSPIPDAKTNLKELENLTYPQKILKIKNENPKAGWYACIRHLAYLEHPDTNINNKPKVNIIIDYPQNVA